mmetsp:Transcript_9713/g.18524  ORF Transcript_9713/g.18524 Transcript_9713/m.18524 type:complete len:141 (-) Transcript_9713:112-534(-)|eukprot:CAMPEP_0175131334 /NCGR_PEP_ID=MMETSP0087-20121206/6486_1 /TAXON_ID=136419 /ORGANISM="Unknown Unknown, Strain D1" /LENGTH=140 /DNA_ID=CAMNT_0016413615 /DNA_START=64 /DNA_END=486 /DNA_ORIENTATION=-
MPSKKRKLPAKDDSEEGVSAGVDTKGALQISYSFKKPNWQNNSGKRFGSGRIWKNAKQIISGENYKQLPMNVPTYANIQNGLSLAPPKKYCDITGLPAKYTCPRTKLFYRSAKQFQQIQDLPKHTVEAYLGLRNANFQLR